ncbi:MAG: diaminopimelate epimerase [Thiohalomonadales bacterium]|nr:diaminopimelate epimerase [Thiohalomonadales bacterium]
MEISFTKMQGLGNDFVVIDATSQPIELTTEQVRFLADRRFGVGCDQVLLVEPPRQSEVDFTYRIFNADGGEVEQCGNGARCFARYVRDHGLTRKKDIAVATRAGLISLHVEADGQITVDMGIPQFEPEVIPFEAEARAETYPLQLASTEVDVSVVSMGNPHAVLRVEEVENAPVDSLGPEIEAHRRFPRRVNVGFMQIVDRQHINLRVYERGAGETLACGTGACAAVVVGRQRGWLDDKVTVSLPGGNLRIQWSGEGQAVMMTGPAVSVFEGRVRL